MPRILCIDDDPDICMLLDRYLTKKGNTVDTAFSGNAGLALVEKNPYDVVLCDFRLPDKDGLEMIQRIKEKRPRTQVIIITGYSDVKVAVKAIRFGAMEYVTKPIQPEEILLTIKQAVAKKEEEEAVSTAAPGSAPKVKRSVPKTPLKYVQGDSTHAQKIHRLMDLVASTDMTVVILGESGTGKEVAARTIHSLSKRKDKAFVAVDCGALPKDLAGSELFGHLKGAFTGAINDKAGHFEMANHGTLFLDEIGNLTYENQVKLLRVLQEKKVRKLGDVKDTDIDVRVIVATNEDLKHAVSEGEFREDLFFRINEFNINLPPLRELKSDMMKFAQHFLDEANAELDKEVDGFSESVEAKFKAYFWPGNLREMKNVVRRAALLCRGAKIDTSELPQEILSPNFFEFEQAHSGGDEDLITDLKTIVERAEKRAIIAVLQKTANNKSKAAEIMKIDRKTLYNKMTAYGID